MPGFEAQAASSVGMALAGDIKWKLVLICSLENFQVLVGAARTLCVL